MDCSLPGSSIHGIFQARVLEWVAIAFSTLSFYLNTKMDFLLLQVIIPWPGKPPLLATTSPAFRRRVRDRIRVQNRTKQIKTKTTMTKPLEKYERYRMNDCDSSLHCCP